VRELAAEADRTRERIATLDKELDTALDRHPDPAPVRSLPGMGVTVTTEFIAEAGSIGRIPTPDRLAAALAPVLKQFGKVRYLKRASGGNKTLKRVCFQSAFCSLNYPARKTFYPPAKEPKTRPTTKLSSRSHADASTSSTPCSETASPRYQDPRPPWPLDERIRQPPAGPSARVWP
jgi:transposase